MRALGASRTSVVAGGVLAGNWARDPLWKNARAVPSLDLRFAENKSLTDAKTGASLVTFTRASTGTYVGSDGLIKTATTNEARFDHNPITGESLGLLVEEARTNLVLNSATLSTQSVTVAAAANTLSFYGTGTVTLTGVSTAGPLVGTGANNRVSLTFTPTAGVLILTVSGSVTNAQLEAGAFPTSYIPTTAATATRTADVASITGTAFSSFYNQTEGTVFAEGVARDSISGTTSRVYALAGNAATTEVFSIEARSATSIRARVLTGGVTVLASDTYNALGKNSKVAGACGLDGVTVCADGRSPVTSASSISTPDALYLGANALGAGGSCLNGTIKRLTYFPVRLANPTLQAITQP
jgi:hypothetical protein